jgi:hypothetical protein
VLEKLLLRDKFSSKNMLMQKILMIKKRMKISVSLASITQFLKLQAVLKLKLTIKKRMLVVLELLLLTMLLKLEKILME